MFETFAKYAGIAGLGLGVLLVLYRVIIRKNSVISQGHSYKLLTLVTILVWVTAMTSILVWAYLSSLSSSPTGDTKQQNVERRYLASAIKVESQKYATSYEVKNELTNKIETVNVVISYPQVIGHPDARIERKINELLKSTAGVYKNHKEDYLDHEVNYEVIALEYDTLSISFRMDGAYLGAATSVTGSETLNINLINGEPFELKDLFRSGYRESLLKLVKMRVKCPTGGALLNEPEIRDDHLFFVRGGKLFLIYERREICPGVDGPIELEFSLDLVKPFTNPNGPINYIL